MLIVLDNDFCSYLVNKSLFSRDRKSSNNSLQKCSIEIPFVEKESQSKRHYGVCLQFKWDKKSINDYYCNGIKMETL